MLGGLGEKQISGNQHILFSDDGIQQWQKKRMGNVETVDGNNFAIDVARGIRGMRRRNHSRHDNREAERDNDRCVRRCYADGPEVVLICADDSIGAR